MENANYIYTAYLNSLNNHEKKYLPVLPLSLRPKVKMDNCEDVEPYDNEHNFVYFYSKTEAEILKNQIIRTPEGNLFLIASIRPINIVIVTDEEMVGLIVEKIMGSSNEEQKEKSI